MAYPAIENRFMCGSYRNINPTGYSVGFSRVMECRRPKLPVDIITRTAKPCLFTRSKQKKTSDVMPTNIIMP